MKFTVEVSDPRMDNTLTVTGTYHPAQKQTRTDPSYPAEVEIESLQNEDGSTPLDDDWPDLIGDIEEDVLIAAEEYLTDKHMAEQEDAADAKRELRREE